jgi:glutaredoxin
VGKRINTEILRERKRSLNKQTKLDIIFYTKAGCHLCEQAREILEEAAEQEEYTLTEIDIRSDPALFELYRYRIPVMLINQTSLLEGSINAEELLQAFQQATQE